MDNRKEMYNIRIQRIKKETRERKKNKETKERKKRKLEKIRKKQAWRRQPCLNSGKEILLQGDCTAATADINKTVGKFFSADGSEALTYNTWLYFNLQSYTFSQTYWRKNIYLFHSRLSSYVLILNTLYSDAQCICVLRM